MCDGAVRNMEKKQTFLIMNYEVLLDLHDHEIYHLSCFMKDAERNIKSGVEIAVRIKLSVSDGNPVEGFPHRSFSQSGRNMEACAKPRVFHKILA